MYKDYDLRISIEKRDEAEASKRDLSRKLLKAAESTRDARRAYNSRKRIARLFMSTKSSAEKARCQALLEKLPSEDTLLAALSFAVGEERTLQSAYDEKDTAHKALRDIVIARKKSVAWIDRQYGHVLAVELFRRFGRIELACRYNEELARLDVYFGGVGFPLGASHAHWVFDQSGLAFRRDPGKK